MEAILEAVMLDQVQLREDASTAGHYSSGMNQLVQVELPGEQIQKGGKQTNPGLQFAV